MSRGFYVTFEGDKQKYRCRLCRKYGRKNVGYYGSKDEAYAAGEAAIARLRGGEGASSLPPQPSLHHRQAVNPTDLYREAPEGVNTGKNWVYLDAPVDVYITHIKGRPTPLIVPGVHHRAWLKAYSNWDGKESTINELARTAGMTRRVFHAYKTIHGWTHDSEPYTDQELAAEPDDEPFIDAVIQSRKEVMYHKVEARKLQEMQRAAMEYWNWERRGKPELIEVIQGLAESRPVVAPSTHVRDDSPRRFAAIFSPFNDWHYGKYASPRETRSPYNRDIAIQRIRQAVAGVLETLDRDFNGVLERWIVTGGGDQIHVDTPRHTTTNGTPQDVDGTYREIVSEALDHTVWVIDQLVGVAPVWFTEDGGNHDHSFGLTVLEFVRAFYHNNPHVMVDTSIGERKYTTYGNTLIGMVHGDKAKPHVLVGKMAHERQGDWHTHQHKLIVTAHLHSEWMTEINGVTVYRRPCLSGSDRWHEGHGYTGNKAAASCILVDYERGPVYYLTIPVD
ncbi:MAG: hypothetical protein IT564_12745 [Rhodospirillales bacterium]|nr:hypothetical protein [Rhodospirillales bacterium]